jgi:glycosyltransferase involved in cell wall biosynthesis
VGRNDPSKDYKTLRKTIELVKRKNKIVFHQIGAGFDIGKVDQAKLVEYYCGSDIYISSSCHESYGKVLIEAMSCGLPVVATQTTGSLEIVQEGINGYLVPIRNPHLLANKIIYLLDNPAIAQKMGRIGKKIVNEKFNKEVIINKIIKFWEDLIKNDQVG